MKNVDVKLTMVNNQTGHSAAVRNTQHYYVVETYDGRGQRMEYKRTSVWRKAAYWATRWVDENEA